MIEINDNMIYSLEIFRKKIEEVCDSINNCRNSFSKMTNEIDRILDSLNGESLTNKNDISGKISNFLGNFANITSIFSSGLFSSNKNNDTAYNFNFLITDMKNGESHNSKKTNYGDIIDAVFSEKKQSSTQMEGTGSSKAKLIGNSTNKKLGIIEWLKGLDGDRGIKKIIAAFESLTKPVSSVLESIKTVINTILSSPELLATVIVAIVGAITQLWLTSEEFRNNVILALETLYEVGANFWNNFFQPIFFAIIAVCASVWELGLKPLWNAWVELVDVVLEAILDMWNGIMPIFNDILEFIGPILKAALTALGSFVTVIFSAMLLLFNNFVSVIAGIFEGLFSVVGDLCKGVRSFFQGIIDFITGIFTSDLEKAHMGIANIIAGIFSVPIEILRGVLNAFIGIANGVIKSINNMGFDIPDWVPIIGGQSFRIDIPQIGYLAQGGIVSKATLGVFGENGTEAVIPLQRNTRGIEMIADKIVANMPKESGNGTYLIQLVLEDGTVLAKKLFKNIKNYEIMTGKPAF